MPAERLIACLLVAGLSGCHLFEAATLPPAERITRAFPLPVPVRVAQESLRERLAGDAQTLAALDDEVANRLTVRALECSAGFSIGRFDTVEQIGDLALPRDCLQRHDARLLQFLAARRIGWLLAQPALRPMALLGAPTPLPRDAAEAGAEVDAASAAGVAVTRNPRGELSAVEIPSGPKIASIAGLTGVHGPVVRVSPNGRLAAVSTGHYRGLVVADLETGEKLWETSELGELLAWLPEVSAALVKPVPGSDAALLDLQRGVLEPYLAPGDPDWAVPVAGGAARLLVGNDRDFALYAHTRMNGALVARSVATYRIAQGRGVTSSWPTAMRGGRAIVFITGRDLMMFDLESRAETVWNIDKRILNRYAKLSETTLLLDSWGPGPAGIDMSPWVLDVEAGTLAPALGPGQHGLVHELEGRAGFARTDSRGLWLGDAVAAGEARPVEEVFAHIDRVRQSGAPVAGRAEARLRVPPIDTAPGLASTGAAALAELAKDARIEAVGVYEGKGAVHGHGRERKAGDVTISVHRGDKPVLLVLASYEPVNWRVLVLPGARLAGVLHGGYHPSQLMGVGAAPRHDLGSLYCYQAAGCAALESEVQRLTGRRIDRFQGRYEGAEFTVNRY